ncbi:MAG TPA: hypothetical protein VEH27_16805 [Methylomirabilota bacterium]|nr:hypothetical protein [Methylomirabilota bacterium]
MTSLIIRTEDIKPEHLLELYVETAQDKKTVELLKSASPVILEGSRGTGKSFLLRVAEVQLRQAFDQDRVLPIYVSFTKSSLLQSGDPNQFLNWMMALLCTKIIRALYQQGLLVKPDSTLALLGGGQLPLDFGETRLERLAREYEESYKRPGVHIDSSFVPSVDSFKDAVEDICRAKGLKRFAVFFDEAAHIFRPEQQRQFFTLFRDLRSPFISCNAAVYPGVTFYGQTFQTAHDAIVMSLNRNLDSEYLGGMREIVTKQAEDSQLAADIEERGENFNALAYAVSGNPRLLLKTVALSGRLKTNDVEKVIKEFYRTDIWSEHSGLADRYAGHEALIQWGRDFIEKTVIPDSIAKNDQWSREGKSETTCFFWIHRSAPAVVLEALRLLSYTGIVTRLDSGIVATRGEIGTRYAVNLGCLAAPSANPIPTLTSFGRTLAVKRFTEYGANHPIYSSLTSVVGKFEEPDISAVLDSQLAKTIDVLDLTSFQRSGLKSIGLHTVGKALQASEDEFQQINYVGPKRSRKMMNVVVSSVLEYLSG